MFARLFCAGLLAVGLLAVPNPALAQSSRERSTQAIEPIPGVENPEATKPDLAEVQKLIVSLTNDFRSEQGRSSVRENQQLNKAANYFAHYLAHTDQFSHTADGNEPWDRAAQFGYDYCIVLENIAYEFNSEGFTSRGLAEALVTGWKKSPGHRKNMLDKDVTETGVAVARSSTSGYYYAVQMFGRPRSDAVVFKLANRSRSAVPFRLDGKDQTLRPGYTLTYTRCRPPEIAFPSAKTEQEKGQVFHPQNGSHYVISADEAGGLQVKEE